MKDISIFFLIVLMSSCSYLPEILLMEKEFEEVTEAIIEINEKQESKLGESVI